MAAARNMNDKFLLGFDAMDEVHGEFLQLVAALVAATDEQLKSALATIAAHLELHFELEDGWMTQTEFPPRECHIDEHAAVMKSVRDVQGMLVAGEEDGFATARALAMALEDWFPGHATHLGGCARCGLSASWSSFVAVSPPSPRLWFKGAQKHQGARLRIPKLAAHFGNSGGLTSAGEVFEHFQHTLRGFNRHENISFRCEASHL